VTVHFVLFVLPPTNSSSYPVISASITIGIPMEAARPDRPNSRILAVELACNISINVPGVYVALRHSAVQSPTEDVIFKVAKLWYIS
jgi:hypothetical protein